jgi:hypothetical protein
MIHNDSMQINSFFPLFNSGAGRTEREVMERRARGRASLHDAGDQKIFGINSGFMEGVSRLHNRTEVDECWRQY